MNSLRVAVCSFFDGVRQPVFFITTLSFLLINLLLPVAAQSVIFQQRKMVIDSSLALIFSLGFLLVLFLADSIVRKEIAGGKALLFFVKPVRNIEYVLGKVLGLLAVVSFFVSICALSCLMMFYAVDGRLLSLTPIFIHLATVVVALGVSGLCNYYFSSVFSSTASFALFILFFIELLLYRFISGSELFLPFLSGCLLILLALFIFNALAVMVSVKWSLAGSIFIGAMFFVAGVISRSSHLFASFFPDWRAFWSADMLSGDKTVPVELLVTGSYRCFVFNLLFIFFAVLLLNITEVGKSSAE